MRYIRSTEALRLFKGKQPPGWLFEGEALALEYLHALDASGLELPTHHVAQKWCHESGRCTEAVIACVLADSASQASSTTCAYEHFSSDLPCRLVNVGGPIDNGFAFDTPSAAPLGDQCRKIACFPTRAISVAIVSLAGRGLGNACKMGFWSS